MARLLVLPLRRSLLSLPKLHRAEFFRRRHSHEPMQLRRLTLQLLDIRDLPRCAQRADPTRSRASAASRADGVSEECLLFQPGSRWTLLTLTFVPLLANPSRLLGGIE